MPIYDIEGDVLQVRMKDGTLKNVMLKDEDCYAYMTDDKTMIIFGEEFFNFLEETDWEEEDGDSEFMKRYLLFKL